VDKSGRTPLDTAIMCGNAEIIKILGGEVPDGPRRVTSWADAKSVCTEGQQYCDPDFPADLKSLCCSEDLHPRFSGVEWKRASQLIEVGVARLDLAHLSQVELGCCGNAWLLSSILVTMEKADGLTQMFDQREVIPEGVYSFVFRFNNEETKIVIDDRVPCLNGTPMYGGPGANNNIAFMLLEKALAKMIGSYEGLARGVPSQGFLVSPIGKALFDLCKPPPSEAGSFAELNDVIHDTCKSTICMMIAASTTIYGNASTSATLMSITEFFTKQVEAKDMGIVHSSSRHEWAAQAPKALPGTGSVSCQDPVVRFLCSIKSKVRIEVQSPEAAQHMRIFRTASDDAAQWSSVRWYHVPGNDCEFDVVFEPCTDPYIIFMARQGEPGVCPPCSFSISSDKELQFLNKEAGGKMNERSSFLDNMDISLVTTQLTAS